jgi:hypothetical protein
VPIREPSPERRAILQRYDATAAPAVEPGAYQVVLDKNSTTPYDVNLTAPFTITG